jgi:pimeloyl-ACP methyl ester carboxylesterase
MRLQVLIAFFLAGVSALAQEKVSFLSGDSLRITADLYLKDQNLPFILLFHQGGSSRGEYNEIAVRLMKLEYNCLAVDLRSGGKTNYVTNETAERAFAKKIPVTYLDARKDINAAINFVRKYNNKAVVLFGSSYSASLCLIIAMDNPGVKAIVAFSPGEFFRPEIVVKEQITGLTKPVFISATKLEEEYIELMFAGISPQYKYEYKPTKGKGVHGAKTLWDENEDSDQCWLELILFFKQLRY